MASGAIDTTAAHAERHRVPNRPMPRPSHWISSLSAQEVVQVSIRLTQSRVDISRYRQNAFAICICSGVRHSGSKSAGEQTKMLKHRAREVATLSRLRL